LDASGERQLLALRDGFDRYLIAIGLKRT